jgi:hypothetical protein
MKMLTKEITKRMPKLYATEKIGVKEKPIACKFFTPWTNWTWYVVEGEKQEDGDYLFWGLVEGQFTEFGYFTLSELTSVTHRSGLKIERDMWFGTDKKIGDVWK